MSKSNKEINNTNQTIMYYYVYIYNIILYVIVEFDELNDRM
jgi:hypothetical protein